MLIKRRFFMRADNVVIMLDSAAKFHRSTRIWGWFHAENEQLESVHLAHPMIEYTVERVGILHEGVKHLGSDKGFEIQCMMSDDVFPDGAMIHFKTNRKTYEFPLQELLDEALCRISQDKVHEFHNSLKYSKNIVNIIDIGGRARSKLDRSKEYPNKQVTVVDILPGENVDVVGDVHEISSLVPPESQDAFLSISVFEHLLMPWKVVLELNKVLKTGAIGLVHTHQTIGMHDMPWDFWRFSDTSWDALFNKYTGFEITGTILNSPQFIIPYQYVPSKLHAERSLGFEGSTVIVRKTGPALVDWPVKVTDIVDTTYPDTDDESAEDR